MQKSIARMPRLTQGLIEQANTYQNVKNQCPVNDLAIALSEQGIGFSIDFEHIRCYIQISERAIAL